MSLHLITLQDHDVRVLTPDDLLVVGFIEIQDSLQKPADYYDAASPEYDFIVFTARAAREDHCATLQFKPRQTMAQP